jgi:DNA-3-methyladenine glycosylase II
MLFDPFTLGSVSMPVDMLDEESLLKAIGILAGRDPDLASIVQRYGYPPMWSRPPGFATLIRIILEQQVSLSSARAAYNRLSEATGNVNPSSFLKLSDRELKSVGFSRQKTRYGRQLARDILDGSVDLEALEGYNDEEARSRLMAIKGIGRWSADIYLLMALRRPDVWPQSDIALIKAVTRIKELKSHPTGEEWDAIGEAWRPWRSVAARLVWFEYLGGRP